MKLFHISVSGLPLFKQNLELRYSYKSNWRKLVWGYSYDLSITEEITINRIKAAHRVGFQLT